MHEGATSRRNLICYRCGKEGHFAKNCTGELSTATKPEERDKTSVKLSKAEKEEVETTIYMAKAEKRKVGNPTVEPLIDMKQKKKKSSKRPIAEKSVDPEVVEFYKKVNVPLELVARHGSNFATQSKRAIRTIYRNGKEYRDRLNPVMMDMKLSHAMTVKGTLRKIPCE
jgi:hypothetical protein